MGWTGSLTASSAVGSEMTFSPDTSTMGEYTVSTFTAPRKGIYRFDLKGSGGATGAKSKGGYSVSGAGKYERASGGIGGKTTGYLLLEKGETVHVGCGGTCSAAFVSSSTGTTLANVKKANLYFVAGAGGQGGTYVDDINSTGYNCYATAGGNGGGTSGKAGASYSSNVGGGGGTQSAGGVAGGDSSDAKGSNGAYGTGGSNDKAYAQYGGGAYLGIGGRGGDGYYGGGSGQAYVADNAARSNGGGGGSGYVKTASFVHGETEYKSSTSEGSGAAAGKKGSIVVTYYARAELPVTFNGTKLEKIIFNGTEITSLIFNGTKLFFERMKKGALAWSAQMMTDNKANVPV